MFVVRVHFRNGVLLNYGFMDMGQAKAATETCAAALALSREQKPAICVVFDEGGREAHLDGADMIAVQMVDVEAEVWMDTRLRVVAMRTEAALLEKAGVSQPSAPNGQVVREEPPPPPPVRSIGEFAA